MPMNRYEVRDEYSLADPELYRAADKDDPEALLEGVAMAGLVGVLRQLGDLAEFAAEIFHDLHEEVTATAARGHNLMIRVQQLEAEVPSIEKAFLSQTDLSSFYYNGGVDWHANLRLDQNLVTQGDLPRFVMDSYEECRGPPRLFLLDKFDVAGAGACLKRYTDPSFFKMETSATATPAVQREKKIRKAKKKGSRGRYGETPETLQASSHAKLHQLLLEESVESGVAKPAYRARLKRRPNRFPFDSKSGKSYMEEFLKNPSPEHKMLQEITVSSPLKMSIDDQNESPLKLRSVSPARGSEGIKSNPPYIDIEEIMPNPSMNKTGDASTDIKFSGVSSHLNILTDGIPSTSDEENGGNDIAIDAESKMEGSLIGYQSDEIASEIDNYVDAPSTMESEMDTDSEFRGKNDFTSRIISQPLVSVTNQEHCHSLSLDSLSTGDFSISDEGNNSYKKGMSDSPRTSAENPRSEKLPADGFPSADIHEFAIFNASSFGRTPEQFPADDVPKPVVSNNAFPVNDSGPEERPEFGRPTSSLCTANSVPGEGSARVARSDETVSNSDDDEKKRDLIFDLPCSPSSSHSKSLENASQRSSTVEHLVDGEVPCLSARADIIHHTSDSLDGISAYLVNEDDYDQKTSNEFENMVSPANMDNITFPNRINTEKIASKENATPVKMDNKVTQLTGNFANNYTDIAHNGDNVTPEVSEGDQNNLYSKDLNVVSETVDSEDYSPVLPEAGLVTFDKEFSAEGLATINGTSEPGIPKTSEVMDLQTGIADLDLNDPIALESSLVMHENLEDSSRISYTEEKDGVNLDSGIAGLQLTDIPTSESWKLLSQVPEPLDELSTSTDQSENVGMDSHVPAVSENIISKNVRSPAGLGKSIEEHVPCFEDLGVGVLENDATSLSGSKRESQLEEKEKSDLSRSHAESGLVEEVDEREAAALDFAAVCRTKHDDHPKPEVLHTNFSSYLDSEVKHMVDMVNASQILTPLEQSGLGNQVSDVDSLHVSSLAEELILPGNIELPSARIDNELPDHSQIRSSQLSSVIPTSQLQMLDHDYDKGFDNFASSSPSPNYPPSLSVLPGLRDYDTVAYAYPKDPSGFMFPPGNLVTETNEVNMHQSPSLPPLPPLQWRIGKLQHASSTTVVDKMEINEVFPQAIFPSEISTGNVSSMPEQTKRSSIQSPQMTIHEENHEQGCPSSEVIAMYGTVSLPQKVENKQEQRHTQLLNPSRESEVPSPAEEVGAVAEGSQMVKLPVQIVSQSASKEENTEHYSTLKADSTDQADDRKVEKDQQQHLHLVLPIEKSEVPSPAKEVGGVAEGSQMVKLPVQIVSQSASKEENAEHYSTLEADSMDQADDQKVEKDQQQHLHLVLPIEKSEVPSPAKEVGGVAEGSQMVKLPVQIVSQSASKEENAEHYSTLEADSTDQADDQKVEKDQQQHLHLVLPIEKSEVPSPAKEVGGVAEGSQMLKLPVQIVSQSASKEENAEHYSTLEADSTDQAVNRKVEKEQQQHLHLVLPIEESEVPSPAVEDEVANGFRTIKLPRSCNPVIGSVAALDKSRLRKVTEQVRPQIQKQDERDALLDQIRAKSFSLKPTATSRPSIQGPNTNLKVAAILEKANAIRQALAGSDEDDEDNWSDS